MATNAIKAHGTTATFDGVTLGEIRSVGGSGSTTTIIKVFTCDSTNEVADKIAGGIDAGQVTLGFVYHGAAGNVYQYAKNRQKAGVAKTLKITYDDTSYSQGQALIQNVGNPNFGDADGAIVEFDVTFELSGEFKHFNTSGGTASSSVSASTSASASVSASASAS